MLGRTQSKTLLRRKALLLAKIETTYNTDPSPVISTDAFLVEEPSFEIDPTILERNYVRDDLSPLGHKVGRRLARMKFAVELRSNGRTNSGSLSDEAKLGRLLRACGFSRTAITGTGAIGTIRGAALNTSPSVTWAIGGSANVNKAPIRYKIRTVLGGASATAKMRVTGYQNDEDVTLLPEERFEGSLLNSTAVGTIAVNAANPLSVTYTLGGSFAAGDIFRATVGGINFDYTAVSGDTNINGVATSLAALIDAHALLAASASSGVITVTFAGTAAGTTMTSGSTALNIGDTGLTLTPTWSGNLVLGDSYDVPTYPTRIKYDPISESFDSVTLYLYEDGKLKKITGGYGDFQISAPAGEYGKVTFTFTGQYRDIIDAATPTPSGNDFETSDPPMIELAQLQIHDFRPTVAQFSYNQGNDITPRPDVNNTDGYNGVRITGRNPTGTINPEAVLVKDFDFYGKMSTSEKMEFMMRAGKTAGNIVWLYAPKTQLQAPNEQSRDGILTYDVGLKFSREYGNDEIVFMFI